MSQIEFKNVSKIYPNGHVGLKDINLNIEKGDFAVIVGLSGAGKSTLLRSVNRLHDITSGDLSLIHISEPTRLHKVSRMPSSA